MSNHWVDSIPHDEQLTCVRIRTQPGLCPGKYRNGRIVDTARWFGECVTWFRLEQSDRCGDWLLIGRAK